MKNKLITTIAITALMTLSLAGCGSQQAASSTSASDAASSAAIEASSSSTTAEGAANPRDALDEKLGGAIFYKSVHNDKTGNWRELVYHSSDEVQDFASEYYAAYFESDDEIHSVVNLQEKTTACLSVFGDDILIDVHEYVDKEEHDATILFTGDMIAQYSVNKKTGEIEKLS